VDGRALVLQLLRGRERGAMVARGGREEKSEEVRLGQ